MRFSLTSLIRLIGLISLAVSAVAVGIARVVPDVPVFRTPEPPRYFGLNGSVFFPPVPRSFVVDAETGRVSEAAVGSTERIEYWTCSPWTTEPGRFEFLGRTLSHEGGANGSLFLGAMLTRFATDGGRWECGRLDVSPAVSGRPCWLPQLPSVILMTGGDGKLYRQALWSGTGSAGAEVAADGEAPVRDEIRWACEAPGEGRPLLSDPICPPIPALRGRVLVTLSERFTRAGRPGFTEPQLWWLELDAEATAVVAAGPLDGKGFWARGSALGRFSSERLSNVAVTPEGRLILAFLGRSRDKAEYRLGLVELTADPETGVPTYELSQIREAGRDVAATTPPLSPEGRWVYEVRRGIEGDPEVSRLSVAEVLGHATGIPENLASLPTLARD